MRKLDQINTAFDAGRRSRQVRRTILLLIPAAFLASGCRDSYEPTAPQRPVGPSRVIVATAHQFTQLDAGSFHSCAVRDDGVVECWGQNFAGQAPATKTAAQGKFTKVGAGQHSTCGIRDDGTIECWGANDYGQAPAVKAPADGGTFTQVSLGVGHACAVRTDGRIECWGNSNFGQAPAMKMSASSTSGFVQVDVGNSNTCALRTDGKIECWGYNGEGEAPALKEASGSRRFTELDMGAFHGCALRDDGSIECWGDNPDGQAPATRMAAIDGLTFTHVSTSFTYSCATRSDGWVECWGQNALGEAPATKQPADGGYFETISVSKSFIAVARRHSCALRRDAIVECWGRNLDGEAPPIKAATSDIAHILPTANFSATPTSVVASTPFTLAFSGAEVLGHPEATTFTYAFDCGAGSGYGAFGMAASISCPTTSAATRTVKGTVKDRDGDVSEYTATVEVLADNTPPVITPSVDGTLGANGWYTTDVRVTWTVTDGQSAVSSQTGCGPTTITADTQQQTITCGAASGGGSTSRDVIIKRDAAVPTLAPAVSPSTVMLNATATAAANASDGGSAVASALCDAPNTASVGTKTVSCTATDYAGNRATKTATYTVAYQFGAFGSPIAGNGVMNVAKAGQTIPLKWRLVDASGSPITTLTSASVTVVALACASGATTDAVEEYASGGSGLQNLGNGYYQYNWSTPKGYAGSCKTMQLDLGEGLVHTAAFQFTK